MSTFSLGFNSIEQTAMNNVRDNVAGIKQSLTRLSTGKRINSAKDDPSGFIATELMKSENAGIKAQIKTTRAYGNKLATMDSYLATIGNLLNDVKGAVVEGANTGALSSDQQNALQQEIDYALSSIERIVKTTTYKGEKLLDGMLDIFSGVSVEFNIDSAGKIYGMAETITYDGSNSVTECVPCENVTFKTDALSGLVTLFNTETEEGGLFGKVTKLLAGFQAGTENELEVPEEEIVDEDEEALLEDELLDEEMLEELAEIVGSVAEGVAASTAEEATTASAIGTEINSVDDILETLALRELSESETVLDRQSARPSTEQTLEQSAEQIIPLDATVEVDLALDVDAESFAAAILSETAANVREIQTEATEEFSEELSEKELAEESVVVAAAMDELTETAIEELAEESAVAIVATEELTETEAEESVVEEEEEEEEKEKICGLLYGDDDYGGYIFQMNHNYDFYEEIKDKGKDEEESTGYDTEVYMESVQANISQLLIANATAQVQTASALDCPTDNEEEAEEEVDETDDDTKGCPDNTVDKNTDDEEEEEEEKVSGGLSDLRSGGSASLKNSPEKADKIIDQAISSLSMLRARIGAEMKYGVDVDITMLENKLYHNEEAIAQISDTDFALETANLARREILLQSSMKALQMSRELPRMLLDILNSSYRPMSSK